MPKVPTKQTVKQKSGNLFVMKHAERRVIVTRPKSYAAALDAVRRHFPNIPRGTAKLKTDELEICKGEMAEITPECWDEVIGIISLIVVTGSPIPSQPSELDDISAPKTIVRPGLEKQERMTVEVYTPSGATLQVVVNNSTSIRAFAWAAAGLLETSNSAEIGLLYNDGDSIIASIQQVGGKPVIYLFSPVERDTSVTLSLIPEWSISVLYPVVPKCVLGENLGEQIRWNVRTHADGTLTETNSGLNIAYLFWEAHTHTVAPISLPIREDSSPAEYFSPCSSDLSDTDSVLLSVKDITFYLDKALNVLGLHTEARTSFITYWLPSFLKHSHVALRFVPQACYARAAPLNITPQPDVITRVFMLFKDVSIDSLPEWPNALARTDADVGFWTDVVGVDLEKTLDVQLYRVLEWGGMEVLRP